MFSITRVVLCRCQEKKKLQGCWHGSETPSSKIKRAQRRLGDYFESKSFVWVFWTCSELKLLHNKRLKSHGVSLFRGPLLTGHTVDVPDQNGNDWSDLWHSLTWEGGCTKGHLQIHTNVHQHTLQASHAHIINLHIGAWNAHAVARRPLGLLVSAVFILAPLCAS